MNCPYCGTAIDNPNTLYCPNCGRPLNTGSPYGANPYGASPTLAGPSSPSYQTPPSQTPPSPAYGGDVYGTPPAPPAGDPGYGQAAPPSYGQPPTAGYGQSAMPSYGQPAPPSYGQAAPLSYGQPPAVPGYGQSAMPGYGQATPPSYGQPPMAGYGQAPMAGYGQAPMAGYGQAAPPSYGQPPVPGYAPAPGGPPPWGAPVPTPPRRSNTGLLIGGISAGVIVVLILGFVAVKALGGSGGNGSGGGAVIYQSSLTGTLTGWPNDSHCSPRSDGYHIPDGYTCFALPAGQIGDATVTVDVKQTKGPSNEGYGLALRGSTDGNYYDFVIDGNGRWAFFKCGATSTDCNRLHDYTSSSAIHGKLNQKNRLKAVMKGSHFDFYVNNTLVGSASDSSYTGGYVGIGGSSDLEAVFTNFKVTH